MGWLVEETDDEVRLMRPENRHGPQGYIDAG